MSESAIKLLSGMTIRRAVTEDSKRQSGLLELPNELLMPIVKGLSDNELLSLIFLCRRLHLLVVPVYLARIEVLDDRTHFSTDKITIRSDKFASALCLLQRSLCITSVKHLACHFPGLDARVVADVRKVHRYVSRMSSVNSVSLNFDRHYSRQQDASLAVWGAAFGELLKTLSSKSCTAFTIAYGDQPANSFVPFGPNPFTRTKRSLLLQPFIAMKDWLKHRRSSDPLTRPDGFAKALLPIDVLSGSQTTSLSLCFIRLGPQPWAFILSHLTLPVLSELHITCCSIALTDLTNFLSRHSLITIVDLSWVLPIRPVVGSPPKSILPNLKSISANLEVISYFSICKFPSLDSISVPLTFIFTKRESQMEEIDSKFASLVNRNIILNLSISFDFDEVDSELTLASENLLPGKDNHRWQSLVKNITLNTGVQHPGLTQGAINFLPPWIGHHFNTVEQINLGYNCICHHCPYHRISLGSSHTLAQMFRSACPHMKKVTINGTTYAFD